MFFLIPNSAHAVDPYTLKKPFGTLSTITFDGTTAPIAKYIESVYKYAIGAVAILAAVVMIIGGAVWMTAAGSQTRIGEAKQWITGALIGLVLSLCSFMILQTVNPDLVAFKPIAVTQVKPPTGAATQQKILGCCITNCLYDLYEKRQNCICTNKIYDYECPKNSVGTFIEGVCPQQYQGGYLFYCIETNTESGASGEW